LLGRSDGLALKKPSCAERGEEAAVFILSLEKDIYLTKRAPAIFRSLLLERIVSFL
jgi:hypothetical protein